MYIRFDIFSSRNCAPIIVRLVFSLPLLYERSCSKEHPAYVDDSKSHVQDSIDQFLEDEYLELTKDGDYRLGARAFLELKTVIDDEYPDLNSGYR